VIDQPEAKAPGKKTTMQGEKGGSSTSSSKTKKPGAGWAGESFQYWGGGKREDTCNKFSCGMGWKTLVAEVKKNGNRG